MLFSKFDGYMAMLMTLMVLMMKMVVLGSWSEKKRDYVGTIPKLGGVGGLTQTHFLISIY